MNNIGEVLKIVLNKVLYFFVIVFFTVNLLLIAQIKPKVNIIGGDNNPTIKKKIQNVLEVTLLEINRVQKGKGTIEALKPFFTDDAFIVFTEFVENTKPYSARKTYQPQLIERNNDNTFDIRSIALKVDVGDLENSDTQNLVFSFNKLGVITSVRIVLPKYDYQSIIAKGTSQIDSTMRGQILDFVEQFRMAYNSKDINFLKKVYSDDALIITGTIITEKKETNEMLQKSFLSKSKIRLVQQTKEEYIDKLVNKIFKYNKYLNIRFEDLQIIQHEKYPYIYGVSCWQHWNTSTYSDKGYLFLMMDFKNINEPVIHVRTWQPKAFEEDESYISLYDFDVVEY